MTLVSQSTLGVNFTEAYDAIDVDTTPENPGHPFDYGTRVQGTDGSVWIFGKVGTGFGVSEDMAVLIDTTAELVRPVSNTAVAATGRARFVGWYQGSTALTAGMAAWFMISGAPEMNVGGSCNAGVQLYTTNVSGQLDDVHVTGSSYPVRNVYLLTANGSGASAKAGFAGFPSIGATGEST